VLLATAQGFESEGRWEVAEAIYLLILERYAGTPSAAEARARLSAPASAGLQRSGRVELQVWSTMYGLWLGLAVPTAFGSESSSAYGVGLLLGGPTGLLVSRSIVRSRSLSQGQVRAITWGGTWGTWQGFGWAEVFDVGEETVCFVDVCYAGDESTEELFASAIAGGLTGIAVGALIARNPIRTGVASGAYYGSLWGTWLGIAGAGVADVDGGDRFLTVTLLAGNAGLVGGALVAGAADMSRDRVRLISLGGLVGLLGGAGLVMIAQPDDERVGLAIPLATSLIGLGVGAAATRDYDRRGASAPGGEGDGLPGLLSYRDGTWGWGVPMPIPALLPYDGPSGRPEKRLGVSFELFSARFR
jgi:hypothetical protein